MRRRAFLTGLCALATGALPRDARAETTPPRRIGYVYVGSRHPNVGLDGLIQGLTDKGYVLGRDLILLERYGEGRSDRIPACGAVCASRPLAALRFAIRDRARGWWPPSPSLFRGRRQRSLISSDRRTGS